jgi:hypothetical protein
MKLMLVGAVAAPQTTLATPADAADRVDRITPALRQSPVFADPGVYCSTPSTGALGMIGRCLTITTPARTAAVPVRSRCWSGGGG